MLTPFVRNQDTRRVPMMLWIVIITCECLVSRMYSCQIIGSFLACIRGTTCLTLLV